MVRVTKRMGVTPARGICLGAVLMAAAVSWCISLWQAQPAWKRPLAEAAALVLPVNSTGAIPKRVKVEMHRCKCEILTRELWTVTEAQELFEVLDRGLAEMKGKAPDSDEYAWAMAIASSPIEAIDTRFHYGAPVTPDAAAAIQDRILLLMDHQSLYKRLDAVSAAIYGYMENRPEIRAKLHTMVNDPEPLIAAMCRRFVREEQSPPFVEKRTAIQLKRGY